MENVRNEFNLSILAYMNYVQRKLKRDSTFNPHPLVKALNCAIEGSENGNVGQQFLGVSGDANLYEDDAPRELYGVVIRKEQQGFTLLEVRDLTIDRVVPLDASVYLILLSMKFDKFEGLDIPTDEVIRIFNETLPGINIIRFPNEEWKSARDDFRESLKNGKFNLNREIVTEDFINDFTSITETMPWEDYPPRVRSTIASDWLARKKEVAVVSKENIVFSSIDNVIQKHKALHFARQILFGKPSEYFANFSVPEQADIKFEHQNNNHRLYDVGRNDPCPCGSGKKYKKCCGKS